MIEPKSLEQQHLSTRGSARRSPVLAISALVLGVLAPALSGWAQSSSPSPVPTARPAAPAAQLPTPEASGRFAAPIAAARKEAEALRVAIGSPGVAVAVAVGGKIVWTEGLGEADAENHAPVRPKTRFRVGSLSKLLTVALAARLLEEGQLDLDAPVQRYVPTFPVKDPAKPITARYLAGHLSGIRHYAPADFAISPTQGYANLTEALKIFRDDPLLAAPGEKYNYSSYAYNLFGVALEGAGGGEYLSLVRRYVLEPLALEGTGDDDPYAIVAHRARPYQREGDGTLRNEKAIDSRFKLPSGGFLSTASDLAVFAGAHAKAGFLKKETLDLLFTSQKTTAGEETGVGIGWRIGQDTAGRRFRHHGGSIEGGRAMLVLYPDQDLAIAILTNLSQARYGTVETQRVAEPFLAALGSGDPNAAKPAN